MASRRRPGVEQGSATVWAMPMFALLAAVAVLLAHVGGALVAQRRAQAAADLAALAGADAAGAGRDGCGAARTVAARNDAHLEGCLSNGVEVTVKVGVPARSLRGGSLTVRAQARAGPAASVRP